MSVRAALRSATAAKHEMVDATFGRFDLANAYSYGRFLLAHARVLPDLEARLAARHDLPPFVARSPLLEADIAALGLPLPTMIAGPPIDSEAAAFGTLYVLEGSRLGGGLLARSIPPTLPHAYLSASHEAGNWRRFLDMLEDRGTPGGISWIRRAIEAAEATFDHFAAAAKD